MCDNTNPSTQSIADYLAQLLKDRKQLAAFPNVFMHMERLLDEGRSTSSPPIYNHRQATQLAPIADSCHHGDHKSDVSTNATTHTILSLFLSSPAELWSSGVCNAIPHFGKRTKAERLASRRGFAVSTR